MLRCIVSTRPDRGVSITYPDPTTFQFLTCGGAPAGYFGRTLDRDWEIEKYVRHGHAEHIAAKFFDAVISGGLTDAGAYELLRDRDVPPDWHAIELCERDTIPLDRWFRNAWVRSRNGGPIFVDLERAARIQAENIFHAHEAHVKNVKLERLASTYFESLPELPAEGIAAAIKRARTPEELRAVWPEYLSAGVSEPPPQ